MKPKSKARNATHVLRPDFPLWVGCLWRQIWTKNKNLKENLKSCNLQNLKFIYLSIFTSNDVQVVDIHHLVNYSYYIVHKAVLLFIFVKYGLSEFLYVLRLFSPKESKAIQFPFLFLTKIASKLSICDAININNLFHKLVK